MSFTVDETDDDIDLDHSDDEAEVLVDMSDDWAFSLAYDAYCSACNAEVDLQTAPGSCHNCNRDFVDWKEA